MKAKVSVQFFFDVLTALPVSACSSSDVDHLPDDPPAQAAAAPRHRDHGRRGLGGRPCLQRRRRDVLQRGAPLLLFFDVGVLVLFVGAVVG